VVYLTRSAAVTGSYVRSTVHAKDLQWARFPRDNVELVRKSQALSRSLAKLRILETTDLSHDCVTGKIRHSGARILTDSLTVEVDTCVRCYTRYIGHYRRPDSYPRQGDTAIFVRSGLVLLSLEN
jgi:hypothetical protein